MSYFALDNMFGQGMFSINNLLSAALNRLLEHNWQHLIVLGVNGNSPTRITIDLTNLEGGTRVSHGQDLTDNDRDFIQTGTQNDQPELVKIGRDWALRADNDDGTNGDSMTYPVASLSGATKSAHFFGARKTENVNETLIGLDDYDYRIKWVSGIAFAWYADGIANNVLYADADNNAHLYCCVFDGSASGTRTDSPVSENGEVPRARIRIDGAWRSTTSNGTFPTSIPTLSAGQIFRYSTAEPFEGDFFIDGVLTGDDVPVNDAELEAIEADLKIVLDFFNSLPDPNTSLTESETVLSTDGYTDETADGYILTPGTTATVASGVAFTHRGFPGGRYLGSDNVICAFRAASTHGVDLNGAIYRSLSDDNGATWGAEALYHSTPGYDDRDIQFFADNEYTSYLHFSTGMQGIRVNQSTGGVTNLAGFPFHRVAKAHTNRPQKIGDNQWILCGGQFPFTGLGTHRRIGILDLDAGTLRWLKHPNNHLDEAAWCRVDDNTIIITCRAQSKTDYTQTDNLVITRSEDNGSTWSDWKEFSTIAAAPNMILHSSGVVVLTFRWYGSQVDLGGMWSADKGLTWSEPQVLYVHNSNDSGYPVSIELPDQRLLCFHYRGNNIFCTPITVDGYSGAVGGDVIKASSNLEGFWHTPEDNYDPDVAGTATWLDDSGNDRHLTRTAGATAPTLNATTWPGTQAAVDFNGSQYLENDVIGALASGDDVPMSVGVAVKLDAIANFDRIWAFGDNNTSGAHWFSLNTDLTNVELNRFDGSAASSADIAVADTTAPHRIFIVFKGTTFDAWLDGTKVVTDGTCNRNALTLTKFALMGLVRNNGTLSGGQDGKVRALAVWTGTKTDEEIEAYDADMALLAPLT